MSEQRTIDPCPSCGGTSNWHTLECPVLPENAQRSSNPLVAELRSELARERAVTDAEIERLTAELKSLGELPVVPAAVRDYEREQRYKAEAERDRLRAALENIAKGRVGDQVMLRPDLYAQAQLAGAAVEVTPSARVSAAYKGAPMTHLGVPHEPPVDRMKYVNNVLPEAQPDETTEHRCGNPSCTGHPCDDAL